MKKPTTIGVTLLSVCMLWGLWFALQASAVAHDGRKDDLRFVGTSFIVFLLPDQPPLPAIGTVHADGTFVAIDGTDEGLAGTFDLNSAALGVWVQSGSRQITVRSMHLVYENTIPLSAVVNNLVADYDADFSNGFGVVQQRLYDLTAGENPTDPDQGMDVGDPILFQFFSLELDGGDGDDDDDDDDDHDDDDDDD